MNLGGCEDTDAIDLTAAGQRTVETGQRARGGMAVGRWNLRTAPGARVDCAEFHRGGRIHKRLGGHRFGILLRVFEKVHLTGRRRRRLDHVAASGVVARVESDVAIDAERLHDFVAKISADAFAGDAANDFADEPSVGDRVIAVLGAGRPPGLFGRERRRHHVPIISRVLGQRLA